MGGTAADLLGDRVFRAAPLADGEAAEMIRSLRCAPLLFGYRGRPRAAVSALEDQVARVARLVADNPEIAELDLNPVIVTPRGAAAVDVRVRLAPPPPVPSPLGRALG
ncbi:MAG: acetate--CoA ligase family protein, partial [Actinomadura rubrobrunea]|nr:acetate--CoA ligase family protein [Actinomadura rubrobrunea]